MAHVYTIGAALAVVVVVAQPGNIVGQTEEGAFDRIPVSARAIPMASGGGGGDPACEYESVFADDLQWLGPWILVDDFASQEVYECQPFIEDDWHGDLDGDGVADEIVSAEGKIATIDPTGITTRGVISSSPGDYTGFSAPGTLFSSSVLRRTGFVDMDGDGLLDMVMIGEVNSDAGFHYRWGWVRNTLTPPPGPLAGDINGDGLVNFADVLVVLTNWS